MTARRWICVGRVMTAWPGYGMTRICWTRDGRQGEQVIVWRGREDWCQPMFLGDWSDVERVVGTRLRLAGGGLVARAWSGRLGGLLFTANGKVSWELWVEVERSRPNFRMRPNWWAEAGRERAAAIAMERERDGGVE